MIDLTCVILFMSGFFAYIGFSRGFGKEIIASASIFVGLFAIYTFNPLIQNVLGNADSTFKFFVQSVIFLIIVFFGYQTRALIGRDAVTGRNETQNSILGGITGFINGYLIFGSLWWLMKVNGYPLSPSISPPQANAPGLQTLLPPELLTASGDGNLLALIMVLIFIGVLVVI